MWQIVRIVRTVYSPCTLATISWIQYQPGSISWWVCWYSSAHDIDKSILNCLCCHWMRGSSDWRLWRDESYYDRMQWTCSLVAFGCFKDGHQFYNHSHSADILRATLVHGGGDKMKIRYESLCYRFVIEWVQIGNYMQFVCNNTVSNCDRWANITNLLPSTSTEVNQKMTLTDCIQSPHKTWFETKVTSPRVVVAGLRITCEMTQALSNNAFTEILPECKQLAASRVPSTKETQMNWAHWCSLHSDWSAFIN